MTGETNTASDGAAPRDHLWTGAALDPRGPVEMPNYGALSSFAA